MLMNHTTRLSNLPSIRKYGLLASYSRQKRAACWFHGRSAKSDAWGENHVRLRHDVTNDDVVHITFDVPRGQLVRHAKDLFYVMGDVPPCRIRRIRVVRRTVEELPV